MSKSPNLGLELTSRTETEKKFIDFRDELAGESETSNMMILDSEIGSIKETVNKVDQVPFTWGMLKNGINGQA